MHKIFQKQLEWITLKNYFLTKRQKTHKGAVSIGEVNGQNSIVFSVNSNAALLLFIRQPLVHVVQNVYFLPVPPATEQLHLAPRSAEWHRGAVGGGPVLDDVYVGDVCGSAVLGLRVHHERGFLRSEAPLVFGELEVAAPDSLLALRFADWKG